MTTTSRNGRRLKWAASLLLAVMLFRAYVPVGFMPSSDAPFQVELCPAAGAVQHHHHQHGPLTHQRVDDCPFGSVPASGPVPHPIVVESRGHIATAAIAVVEPIRSSQQRLRAHQPRGPPGIA